MDSHWSHIELTFDSRRRIVSPKRFFLTQDLDPGHGRDARSEAGHGTQDLGLGSRDAGSGPGVTGRRIWTALLTKYEREGGEGGEGEEANVRSDHPSYRFRSPRTRPPLRLARSHARTHERNETISRLKTSLRKLRLIIFNLRFLSSFSQI